MNTKHKIARFVIAYFAAAGASHVIQEVLRNNVLPRTKYSYVLCTIGVFVIGAITQGYVNRVVTAKYDELYDVFANARNEIK